jgi:hypothetical protein
MREFSIYHQGVFGACRTIRFNLAAIKRLLPEDDIKDFDLTERQRAKLQARVNLYVESWRQSGSATGSGPEARQNRSVPHRPCTTGAGGPRQVLPGDSSSCGRGKVGVRET